MPLAFLAVFAVGGAAGAYVFGESTVSTAAKVGVGIAVGWYAAAKLRG